MRATRAGRITSIAYASDRAGPAVRAGCAGLDFRRHALDLEDLEAQVLGTLAVGVRGRVEDAGLRVVCVKPGFVKTGMTSGLKPPPFAGEADGVARDIVRAIDRGAPVLYTPRIWWLVMQVIKPAVRTSGGNSA